jgi:glycerol-3-phosphate acyltransferase PlsY
LLILCAYLLGSIPTGYLAGLYLKGIDIRECGSGSTGATNVLRVIGKAAAIAVLVIDIFKGAIAVAAVKLSYFYVSPDFLPWQWKNWLVVGAALAVVLGHSKSIWLNFTGGKSAATSLGVLLVINPVVALATLGIFLGVLAISGIVSLSSLSGAIAVNIFMVLLNQPLPYILFAIVAGIYVIIRHTSNIQRLMAGTEPRLGQTSKA